MSKTGREGSHRRSGEVAVALLCVVAFGLIAVALASAGGALGSVNTTATNDSTADEQTVVDRPGVVGSGSLGATDRNPVGAAVGDGANPFVNRSDERLFIVVSDRPAYWRIDAYDEYENGTWIRTGEPSPYDHGLHSTNTTTGTETAHVLLNREAVAMPVAWEPTRIEGLNETRLTLSAERGVHPDEPVPAGSTYAFDRYRHDIDPEGLQTAWGTPPRSIQRQYTQVSDSISGRVEERGEAITADAETSYETVLAITDWIEANRAYDRSVTHDDGDPIDAFLFEMEAGNAEYMASSTTVLLRLEGIPARYVTGYAPGAASADTDDTYAVHPVNAHAWVEVYFAGYGWVPIDPTPSDQRVETERTAVDLDGEMVGQPSTMEALLNPPEFPDEPVILAPDSTDTVDSTDNPDSTDNSDSTDNPDTSDSTDSTDDSENTDNTDNSDNSDNREEPDVPRATDEDNEAEQEVDGSTIALSEVPPAPGQTVTVTARDGEEPRSGAAVRFDGKQIGTTDSNGTVSGTIPYAETVTVEVEAPTDESDQETVRATFPVLTDVTIVAESLPLVSGGEATIRAYVNDVPLTDAQVSLDGNPVGTTDDDGRATINVPEAGNQETVKLTVDRGGFEGERTLPVGEFELRSESPTVLALPGQEITVTAAVDSTPVAGAAISDGGTVVTTTNENGQATVNASWRTTAITGAYAGQEATTQIENRLLPVLLGAGLLVGMSLIAGAVARRYRSYLGLARRRVQTATNAFVTTILQIENVLAVTPRQDKVAVGRLLRRLLRFPVVAIAVLWSRGIAWLTDGLFGLRTRIRAVMGRQSEPSSGTGEIVTSEEPSSTADDGHGDDSRRSVRQVWATFVRLVLRRIDPTWTPGDVARAAIAIGFPSGPVQRLTDIFRAVEYGRGDPDSNLDDATGALSEIERASPDRPTADPPTESDDKRATDD